MNNLEGNSKRKELSRERLKLGDGKMCDLASYHIDDYGPADFVENMEISNGDFRKARSLIPFNYLDADSSKFKWDIYEEDVAIQQRVAKSFIQSFDSYQKEGKGLYIYSKTKGSGKTFLACVLANEIMNRRDLSVKFISVPELLEMTKQSYKDFAERENINKIYAAELLILDDLGAEIKKEWIDTELFRLIDYRYTHKRVTIFTSNISIESLKLNDRIVDRIFSMCIKLNLPEKSIRAMQAENDNIKFLKGVMK